MGTSHRQATVRFVVGALRNGLAELLNLPDGYEIVLGNGGTTAFWDAAAFGLIERRSQHLSFGEFSSKFAAEVAGGAVPRATVVIESAPGTHPLPVADDERRRLLPDPQRDVDRVSPCRLHRPDGASCRSTSWWSTPTSAAGGLRFDPSRSTSTTSRRRRTSAPTAACGSRPCRRQRSNASERIAVVRLVGSPRSSTCRPPSTTAAKDQTYNTPALATLFLAVEQVEWINGNGGLEWAASRCDQSAEILYGWAEASSYATPFVTDPAQRSHVVATIDLDRRSTPGRSSAVLRATASSTPIRTASSAATNCASRCSPPSIQTTSLPHRRASTTSSRAELSRRSVRPRPSTTQVVVKCRAYATAAHADRSRGEAAADRAGRPVRGRDETVDGIDRCRSTRSA